MNTTEGPVIWTMEEALIHIRAMQPDMHANGCVLALGGSVLNQGFSRKDLDLIIHPMGIGDNDSWKDNAMATLEKYGMKCILNEEQMKEKWREEVYFEDMKHVERWEFNGKRVDIFFLK